MKKILSLILCILLLSSSLVIAEDLPVKDVTTGTIPEQTAETNVVEEKTELSAEQSAQENKRNPVVSEEDIPDNADTAENAESIYLTDPNNPDFFKGYNT